MAKAVRLADIAQQTGVSIVTVSKALSGQKGVSEEMREKIIALADELGYRPVSQKKQEEVKKSYNIGVLIHEEYLATYNSFYLQLYQYVATYAVSQESFSMMETVTHEMEDHLALPKLIRDDKVDGVIIIGKLIDNYLVYLNENIDVPVVYLDFCNERLSVDAIISDSFYGAYYMTNYLFDMGHTKIAYVGTLLATGSITDRYLGYVKSLMEHGVEVRSDWLIDDRYKETGKVDEEHLICLPEEMPTAFFCNCDSSAAKLIRKLENQGYRIPEDISVVGYDNFIYPGVCNVEITSYEVDMKEMAAQAVTMMLKKLNGESFRSGIYIVEGHIVIKESVKKLKH